MKATKTLPTPYCLYHTIDLSSKKLVLGMNVAGVLLLFIFGWLFTGAAAALNPRFFVLGLAVFARTLNLAQFLFIMIAVVVLHELAHALFFWLFTGERPKIGFSLLYAYAAAPGWYFPRRQFIIIGLAPAGLLTATGLLLMPFVNFITIPRLILALTVNAAGSVGDLITVAWLLLQPAGIFVRDEGAAIKLYRATGSESTTADDHPP